ncbi:MAG: DUF2059 domain-containing protein [Verrucomicrobia bacterium]|nr:DUF2059 domain-containing protein [Verrucomicrobiota bacterium]
MKNLFLAATIALSLSASFSMASEESHRATAQELITLTNPKSLFITAFMVGFNPMLENMKKSGLDEIKIEKTKKAAIELAKKVASDPELNSKMVSLYTGELTEKEIRDLITFYHTPTGKKALRIMPAIFQKGALIGQQITQKYQADFQKQISTILQGDDAE